MRRSLLLSLLSSTLFAAVVGCQAFESPPDEAIGSQTAAVCAVNRGRSVWFNNTYGDQKFYAFLASNPDPARRIDVGLANVVHTPRAERFATWGVINDPDCQADPGGGVDLCADPNATGVVGIRKFPGPGGTTLYGVSCASCHAGFNPLDPPIDPSEPTWDNIHPTIGNQFLDVGAIFAANLPATDPRRVMFAAWPRGAVDTTLLFSDNIMNPGTITGFWQRKKRNHFDVGLAEPQLRNGQGGEDDVGGELAAIRVYTNIGACFAECVAPAVAAGRPIDVDSCREACPDFPPEQDLEDLNRFLDSIRAPRYRGPRDGARYARGRQVFESTCAGCHDRSGRLASVLSSDDVVALDADPANTTNRCRSLTSNWQAGHIWEQFSSDVYKQRVDAGLRGYRVMPLAGIWTTAPFLHNQSIGERAPATASPDEQVSYYQAAMRELLRADRTPRVNRLPVPIGPFPAGTPLAFVFSRDPATGALLCDDVVENRGHTYGASLPDADKDALIHWLQFQ